MLKFRQYLIVEQKKNELQQMISQSVEKFRQELKSGIITESFKEVNKLKDVDLHQTEQNRKLARFVDDFNNLTQEQQFKLVKELSKPKSDVGYIQNNNQIKLILIYKNNKDSKVGQEAYNAVVMNKQGLFRSVAAKKVKAKSIARDQAPDFVQQMFTTLCGGGMYNDKNGSRYSIDGYDPYSKVPFTAFVQQMTIPAAFNKFQARYDTSITRDYIKQRENAETLSADDENVKREVEEIPDTQKNILDIVDEKQKNQLINKILNDQIPQQYRLNEKEKQFVKLYFIDGLSKKDCARKLGYSQKSAAPISIMYLGTEKEEGKAVKHLKQAIKYLQK